MYEINRAIYNVEAKLKPGENMGKNAIDAAIQIENLVPLYAGGQMPPQFVGIGTMTQTPDDHGLVKVLPQEAVSSDWWKNSTWWAEKNVPMPQAKPASWQGITRGSRSSLSPLPARGRSTAAALNQVEAASKSTAARGKSRAPEPIEELQREEARRKLSEGPGGKIAAGEEAAPPSNPIPGTAEPTDGCEGDSGLADKPLNEGCQGARCRSCEKAPKSGKKSDAERGVPCIGAPLIGGSCVRCHRLKIKCEFENVGGGESEVERYARWRRARRLANPELYPEEDSASEYWSSPPASQRMSQPGFSREFIRSSRQEGFVEATLKDCRISTHAPLSKPRMSALHPVHMPPEASDKARHARPKNVARHGRKGSASSSTEERAPPVQEAGADHTAQKDHHLRLPTLRGADFGAELGLNNTGKPDDEGSGFLSGPRFSNTPPDLCSAAASASGSERQQDDTAHSSNHVLDKLDVELISDSGPPRFLGGLQSGPLQDNDSYGFDDWKNVLQPPSPVGRESSKQRESGQHPPVGDMGLDSSAVAVPVGDVLDASKWGPQGQIRPRSGAHTPPPASGSLAQGSALSVCIPAGYLRDCFELTGIPAEWLARRVRPPPAFRKMSVATVDANVALEGGADHRKSARFGHLVSWKDHMQDRLHATPIDASWEERRRDSHNGRPIFTADAVSHGQEAAPTTIVPNQAAVHLQALLVEEAQNPVADLLESLVIAAQQQAILWSQTDTFRAGVDASGGLQRSLANIYSAFSEILLLLQRPITSRDVDTNLGGLQMVRSLQRLLDDMGDVAARANDLVNVRVRDRIHSQNSENQAAGTGTAANHSADAGASGLIQQTRPILSTSGPHILSLAGDVLLASGTYAKGSLQERLRAQERLVALFPALAQANDPWGNLPDIIKGSENLPSESALVVIDWAMHLTGEVRSLQKLQKQVQHRDVLLSKVGPNPPKLSGVIPPPPINIAASRSPRGLRIASATVPVHAGADPAGINASAPPGMGPVALETAKKIPALPPSGEPSRGEFSTDAFSTQRPVGFGTVFASSSSGSGRGQSAVHRPFTNNLFDEDAATALWRRIAHQEVVDGLFESASNRVPSATDG
ncbi:uncharacterized protein BXZ73DRAFT_84564 [Epithele typhae]|uniref:uncharacterized protein n=1 Tax=Epithele typhae TaxID=378194 RepID=UPI0020080687|nr:uncharacterized protein BXZ73DRAFT_84564 [Epithele typhae]KAH9907649.1 hypothetical protein BXZ73DRAFT_84564 [Epithele typhae]